MGSTATPLRRHRLLVTDDLDRARSEVGSRFCPHGLSLTRRDGRLDLVHDAASIGTDVTINYLRYGDEVRITPGRFEDFFLAQVPLAGTARVRVGERVVASDPRHGSIGSPTEPVDMVWSADCQQLLVYIRRTTVEELASTEPGRRDAVVFDPLLDLQAPAMRSWLRLVQLAVDELEAGGALFGSTLATRHFEQTLVSSLLTAQPNTSGPPPAAERRHSRAVDVVVGLIEAEPEVAWRVADLAAHAGVSPRTLQEAFRNELGTSPLEQLRRTRLARARRDLIDADPATGSVTEIASRWGYFHLGRFSSSYRAVFHELPSQTLTADR